VLEVFIIRVYRKGGLIESLGGAVDEVGKIVEELQEVVMRWSPLVWGGCGSRGQRWATFTGELHIRRVGGGGGRFGGAFTRALTNNKRGFVPGFGGKTWERNCYHEYCERGSPDTRKVGRIQGSPKMGGESQ